MFLIIDIGNTLQKAGVFSKEGEILELVRVSKLQTDTLENLLRKYPVRWSIVSNVGAPNEDIMPLLKTQTRCILFNEATPLPIRIDYKTPNTLGLDRRAAATAAAELFPNENVLVIQAGSCIVTDFVNKDAHFLGGTISPGIRMRFKALHHFTQNLPEPSPEVPDSFMGQDTVCAIRSGIVYGIIDEIEGAIRRYTERFDTTKVILTGGDTELLQTKINFPIFAAPNLVLCGLHKILKINAQ